MLGNTSFLSLLTCVHGIKVFGEESEIAASNIPRNILKILTCKWEREANQMKDTA